jgi:hypothetical protein
LVVTHNGDDKVDVDTGNDTEDDVDDDTDGVEEYMLLCRMLFIRIVEDMGNKSILFIYIL